jgi:hypothetical protein
MAILTFTRARLRVTGELSRTSLVGQDRLHGAHRLTHFSRGGAARLATAGGESECLGRAVESPSPP